MYDPDGTTQAAFGLTDDECLWEKIEAERLISLIERSDIQVREINQDFNNYGEFLFVCVEIPGQFVLDVYGLGFHERRERYITDFRFNTCGRQFPQNERFAPAIRISKDQTVKIIRNRMIEVQQEMKAAGPYNQSDDADTFELVADLADDDFAMMNCE